MSNESLDWWRTGTLYQIYPRSFADAGARGWGDLEGIRQRLPYVASLGVDAIWISPFFKSPMKDFGYDVEDHYVVDPMFGPDEDFDRLVDDARKLGLKIMVDLVLSHTADTHPWFVDAGRSRDSEYSDYFVWADPQPDGSPPNNWLSIFGGSAWAWHPTRRQYYLHNFLKSQPDLNFHNPRVRAEALAVARHWLERGVTGFRLDTVNFYFHNPSLESNPPANLKDEFMAHESNPYSYQDHLYDKNQPEVLVFLSELGALTAEYPGTVTLGEVGAVQERCWALIDQYTRDERLSLCYTFDLLSHTFTAPHLRETVNRSMREAPDTWPCWAFSNHDVARSASRLASHGAQPAQVASMTASILLSLRGTPCVYQGEELAMEEADVPYAQLQDPYGIEFWPDYKGRDGCRTPMPWAHQATHCGFTDADAPWLPIPEAHRARAVDLQEPDAASPLNTFRRIMAIRRQEPALQQGDFAFAEGPTHLLAYTRTFEGSTIHCFFNISPDPISLAGLAPEKGQIFNGIEADWKDATLDIVLGPWDWIWVKEGN